MTSRTQDQKRESAAALAASPSLSASTTAVSGQLAVAWDRPFDQLCHMVSATDLATRNARRYRKLMEEIVAATGCTEEEILAHGNKVRAVLFFAQDRLAKEGALSHLAGRERIEYRQPPVRPAF